MTELYEIKVHRPKGSGFSKMLSPKTDEIHLVNAWGEERNGTMHFCLVGTQKWWKFPNNECDRFLGEFKAEVVGAIDKERAMEQDRVFPAMRAD